MYDLLLKNGNIITLEEDMPKAEWVGVNDGKISNIGIGEPDDDGKEVIDLEGNTVLPGLWDSHVHVMPTGFYLQGVNLEKVTCIQDVLDAMEEIRRLRKELEEARKENLFLKKAAAFFAKEID